MEGTALRRSYLWVEFLALFAFVPAYLVLVRQTMSNRIIATLLVVALVCGSALVLDRSFPTGRLLSVRDGWSGVLGVIRRFLPGALALTLLLLIFRPELFLSFPRTQPRLWLLVMLLYPVLSVFPQEIIFRGFLFHRYGRLFTTSGRLILVSGLAFGAAHLFFGNWIAPVLSAVGGVLFAQTYARTDSLVLASLEHALWGDLIFTIGLGFYFYGGSIQ